MSQLPYLQSTVFLTLDKIDPNAPGIPVKGSQHADLYAAGGGGGVALARPARSTTTSSAGGG